jgi:hypothetical protein
MPTPDVRKTLDDVVQELRRDPEKYKQLRGRIEQASSDEERAEILVDFATSDEKLRGIVPDEQTTAGIGTVTVTTVLTPAGPPRE